MKQDGTNEVKKERKRGRKKNTLWMNSLKKRVNAKI